MWTCWMHLLSILVHERTHFSYKTVATIFTFIDEMKLLKEAK